MTVRFYCECGKRIVARAELRGKRFQCPRCFSLVTVPGQRTLRLFRFTRNATARLSAAAQQNNSAFATFSASSPSVGAIPRETIRPLRIESSRREKFVAKPIRRTSTIRLRRPPRWERLLPDRVEPRWHHAMTYSLAKVPVFMWLSVVLSLLTVSALSAWVSIDPLARLNHTPHKVLAFCLVLMSYALGTTATFFNSILALASDGKTLLEPSIDPCPLHAAKNIALWLVCFLAGPFLFFGAAFAYWLYCGELEFVDWTIIAELTFVGLGWWLFALLLANASDGFHVPLPSEVLRLALRLRGKSIELILLATVVFAGHTLLAAFALSRLQEQPTVAVGLLCVFWGSGLFLTALTLRRIGLAYSRLRRGLT